MALNNYIQSLPSLETLHALLILDAGTGQVFRRVDGRRADLRQKSNGYFKIRLWLGGRKCTYQAHRIIWKMVNGRDPVVLVDHIDRDRTNNRPENLREVDFRESTLNRSLTREPVGVYPGRNGKFRSQIWQSGRAHHIGTFETIEAARAAYLAASAA